MKTDPVCGQTIDPLRARAVAIVAGERYYFCCAEHRSEFAADPARFIAALRPEISAPEIVLAEGSPAPIVETRPPTEDLVRFEIGGMTGADDAERVRRAIARVAGVADVEIDLVTEVATLSVAREAFAAAALVEALATAGYEAAPRARSRREDPGVVAARVERLRRPALAAFAAALVLAVVPAPGWAAAAVALVAGAACARAARRGLPELVLAAGAVALLVGAVVIGDGRLASGSLALVGLALAGRALDEHARQAAGAAIAALPELPECSLSAGDLVRVAAGDVVPVDGVIRSGTLTLDESAASGAAAPVVREAGDPVVAGTGAIGGDAVVEVKRAGRDRTMAHVRAAVVELQGSSAPLTRTAARAAALAPVAAVAAALLVAGLAAALGRGAGPALAAAVGALAAVSALAAALATPTALAVATAGLARRGVLFRNAEAFERARDVTDVVVDKNATLMQGRRQVARHALADGADAGRLIALAAAAEQMSDAPLARALRTYADGAGVNVPPAERATFAPGKGVVATVAGSQVVVGSRRMLEDAGVERAGLDGVADALGRASGVFVAIDGKLAGGLALDEPLRHGAERFVAALGALGIRVALVTGDGRDAAERLARAAGIDEIHADLSPDEKKRVIVGLRHPGGAVAVVGDAVDDASALAAADVGIALGRGADVALAAAAVTVVRGDLDGVLAALAGARRGVAVMRANLALAFAHAALVPAALVALRLGAVAPLVAAATMTATLAAIVLRSRRA